MDARYIAVLEIGSSKVKGAVARVDTDGNATLVATHEVKTINCVRHGRVQNVQEVAARVEEVLRRLENDQAVAPRKIRRLRVALGGRSVCSVHTSVDVRLPAESEITAETIERLKRDAVTDLPADRSVLAVLPRSFNVDGAEVSKIVGMFGRNIHSEMTVILAAPDNRTNLDRVRMASPDIDGDIAVERIYVPRQLALARMALTPSEQQLGVALVDLGAETTTISIHRGGALQTLVTLPMGGRNITRDIAIGLSITEENAEYIKIAQASAIPDTQNDTPAGDAREINSYTQARAGEIIANVIHRIEQAGFKAAELPAGIVLTGRASRMRRMAELFETQTKMKVRIAPADNSVRPGATGADPVDSLDIMALASWPVFDDESDLTEIPAVAPPVDDDTTDYDYGRQPFDDRRAASNARGRRDINENDLLSDDPDDDDFYHKEIKKKKNKTPRPTPPDDDKIEEEEEEGDTTDTGSRFGGMRRFISKLGRGFIGTQGPDDIDE